MDPSLYPDYYRHIINMRTNPIYAVVEKDPHRLIEVLRCGFNFGKYHFFLEEAVTDTIPEEYRMRIYAGALRKLADSLERPDLLQSKDRIEVLQKEVENLTNRLHTIKAVANVQ